MYKESIELAVLLNKIGSDNNLSFSKQDVMKNLALGLDEEQRKMLILQQACEGKNDWLIINLDHVHTCLVKKTYKKINANDLEKRILDEYLENITLHLALSQNKQPVEINFYSPSDHNIFDVPVLERKAKDWEIVISKSLMSQIKYRGISFNYKSQYWQGF